MINTQKKTYDREMDTRRTPYVLAAVGLRAADRMEAGKPVRPIECALAKELDRLAKLGRLVVEMRG